MAQLYYRYGQMNSSKSMQLLSVAHNYIESGKTVLLITSSIDDRYGIGKITSRVGIQKDAVIINKDSDLVQILLNEIHKHDKPIDCILVDEAQFLTREQVISLALIVDNVDIPVICYGLKNDFRNRFFEGSEALTLFADKIEEIKTVCVYCNKKATMILKFHNGKPIYNGEQVEIGGNDLYKSVCRKHYFSPKI